MRIDLTCPVELWNYALPTEKYPVCRLQLFNLTEQTVVSVQAVFSCFDGEGNLISRQVERVQGLAGEGRNAFEVAAVVQDGARAAGMDLSIEKVWFGDGTVWRHTADHVSEYAPNTLRDPSRLSVLRTLAGDDAMGYPSDQGAVWMCVCGRPNAAREEYCRRCGRDKHEVFTRFNEATVETVIFERENALEEQARQARAEAQQRAEEEEERRAQKRRRRRRVVWGVVCALLALILAAGVYFHGIPFYRYYAASRQMQNGVYAAARAEFEALAAQCGKRSLPVRIPAIGLDVDLLDMRLYYSSATLAKECTYREANETLATGTIPALRTAQDAFDGLGDYRDSADLAREARYRRAELLFSARQYENAIALYDEILSYRDARQKRGAALYQWAVQQMEALDFTAAREKFLSLGSYEDSARRAQLCLYQPALSAIDQGEYRAAIELLTQLDPSFENTAVRLQEAYYGVASELFDAQNYDEAAEYYLLAGDYRDAYSQATACLYEPACDLMDAGEYAQAKEMFDKILAFRDAQELSWQCSEALGRAAMETGDYDGARALLADALAYPPALELYQECVYVPASALQEAGDLNGALAMFESIPGYADADERALAIRYEQAEELLSAHEYETALEAFSALGDYSDSEEEARNARYGYALQLMSDGLYEQAAAHLLLLDGFLSSDSYLRQAYYELATLALREGDLEGAADYYLLADTYADAQDLYDDCVYRIARAALAEGDTARAAELLSRIPAYADADELRVQSVYALAEEKQEAGLLADAADLFASISGYEDAAERADACYDAYYAGAYATAKSAMAAKDYALAVATLESVERENASATYGDIEDMYREANYLLANQLYDDKKPYEALTYYRNIPGYRDVDRKLDRVCYRILGKWVSVTGIKMEFREDGTCTIDGHDYYFHAATYAFYVGESPDELTGSWTIHSCKEDYLSIENDRTKSQYRLTRDED